MAFATFDPKRTAAPMADINMVPLIDVMLVLLVIFIVSAPLLTHAVKLDLPTANAPVDRPKPEVIELSIEAGGALFWNGERVARDEAAARMAAAGRRSPPPELHLRADQSVAYRVVARTIADAAQAGLTRVGFVSEPETHRTP